MAHRNEALTPSGEAASPSPEPARAFLARALGEGLARAYAEGNELVARVAAEALGKLAPPAAPLPSPADGSAGEEGDEVGGNVLAFPDRSRRGDGGRR